MEWDGATPVSFAAAPDVAIAATLPLCCPSDEPTTWGSRRFSPELSPVRAVSPGREGPAPLPKISWFGLYARQDSIRRVNGGTRQKKGRYGWPPWGIRDRQHDAGNVDEGEP